MKSYKRFFSVFLCSALLFGLFSLPVSADSVDTSTYKVNILAYGDITYGQIDINNNSLGEKSVEKKVTFKDSKFLWSEKLTFADTTGGVMFKQGEKYNFTAENFNFALTIMLSNGSGWENWISGNKDCILDYCRLVYTDGTIVTLREGCGLTFNALNGTYSVYADFTPKHDVTKIIFDIDYSYNPITIDSGLLNKSVSTWFDFGTFGDPIVIKLDQQSEESGFLSGILSGITDGFNKLNQWISNLPGRIWSAIENGLKGFFVPDDQYMASYSDRWSELLSSRLGAVYEVGEIVTDSWDNIMSADQTDTINLPRVTIPLGDSSFSFGGEDIKIVPDGFGVLVTALKLIVGIVCTVAFINGLLKRYDEVMGVEK